MKNIKYIVVLFVISIGMGFLLSQILKSSSENIASENISGNVVDVSGANEISVETSNSVGKILPTTKIVVETKYQDCKHTTSKEYEATDELINLNEAELKKLYPDVIVKNFSEEEVELYRLAEGLCEDHYKLSVNGDGLIEVYNLDEDYDLNLYETTDISTEYLPDEDVANLQEGIYLYGADELSATLESFE